jgi:hypothetical protein
VEREKMSRVKEDCLQPAEIMHKFIANFIFATAVFLIFTGFTCISAEEITFEFADPLKGTKVVNLNFDESPELIKRCYAHNSSIEVYPDKILYKPLLETDPYLISYKEDSPVAAHKFINFQKNGKEYALLFVLLKNSRIQYYLFDGNITNTNVGRLRNKPFKVPDDVTIEIDFNIEKAEYSMKIISTKFVNPRMIYGDVSFD